MTDFLHEFFERTAQRYPTQVAVEVPPVAVAASSSDSSVPSQHRTYQELLANAQLIRTRLAESVQGECILAIVLPKDSPLVHAAQLAVLQAGAAFLCVDQSFPDDHIRFVLADAGVALVLTDALLAPRLQPLLAPNCDWLDVVKLVAGRSQSSGCESQSQSPALVPSWLTPQSLAYVIYTSGTTGRPKGVLIEHRSIVHLLEAEQQYLQLQPSDRCVQVSSNAYDSSLEECWLPFSVGATVVVAHDEVTRLGPDLVPWLRQQRISVLMPTPTMLRATGCREPAAALPNLRLVYVGGEAITADLVAAWAGRIQLENGYGPTECTVTVTRARLWPDRPITIGQPIGQSRAHVLAADLQPVASGAPGELCISGPCLARGYLDRAELTAERFVEHAEFGRIYRTGDLVQLDERGDLLYLGRIDAQVKVRGYRIELAAIESLLQDLPEVRAAACKVQGVPGRELLVAHVVPARSGADIPAEQLAAALRAHLPDYMVPSRFAMIAKLPRLVSGKLDRKALPDIAAAVVVAPDGPAPQTPLQQWLAEQVAATLALPAVAIDADFFALGGNSLRAAELITRLRRHPSTEHLAVRDVYAERTVLALSLRAERNAVASTPPRPATREPRGRPLLVTLVQTLWLAGMLVAGSCVLGFGAYVAVPWLLEQFGLWSLLVLLPALQALWLIVYAPLALLIAVAAKRLLVGRYQAVRAPVWGGLYLRNWLVQRCVRLVPWRTLEGTEFQLIALRQLGARIGKRVHIHRGVDLLAGGWDLLTLGDDATLSQDAIVGLVEYDDGEIVFGSVTMADGSTLDIRAGMQGGSSLGVGAYVTALSNVTPGTHVPDGETWDGVPAARVVGAVETAVVAADAQPRLRPWTYGLLLIASRSLLDWLLLAPLVVVAAIGIVCSDASVGEVLDWLWQPSGNAWFVLLAVMLGTAAIGSRLCMAALVLRYAKAVAAGQYRIGSLCYLRIWLRTGLVQSAGDWLSGSLYWRWWLRTAGMRLGPNCEISTILDVLPEQVAIGGDTFFADGVYLAGPRLRAGIATVAPTTLLQDSFVGNHAVLPAGCALPAGILIGVSTVADAGKVRAGTSWFGQPPIELPQREVLSLDRSLTHEPTAWLYWHRLFWETLRFVLPAVLTVLALVWLEAATQLSLFWLPLLTLAVGSVLLLLVLALKWLLLGRVRPGTHGLWSMWCCRWDFLYMAWGMLAHGPLSPLAGTLWLPWYLRAMGMRIGKRVVLAGSFAQVVDPDMLTVEDGATIDPMFQAHTFEDRVLKIGPVHIGKNATVGRATVLFYGTKIEARCSVAPHSVVMKNETLSTGRDYVGVPTRRVAT